ncbi:MAG: GntR family transcriptional regulator [Clostridia bacterium]|nr:GntR family transcriptional regulator [Clostridia bacterium]
MRESTSVDIVYNYIREQILARAIFPGNRIIEEDIAKKTNVSRISVRSALTRLEHEGYIVSTPNHSACLITPTKDEMIMAFETRLLLETAAARAAIDKITDEAIDRMESMVGAQKRLLRKFSLPEFVRINREIHWELVKASGNPYLEKFLNEIYNKCTIYLLFFDNSENDASVERHEMMIKALRNRDLPALEEAIKTDLLFYIEEED